MSADDDLPDLAADARAALADAKALVDPGDAVRARMRSRLMNALPPPDGGGGGDDPGPQGGSGGGSSLPKAPLWVVAAALAIGGAAGMLVPRAPVERIVVVPAPPTSASSVAPSIAIALAPSLPAIDAKDLPSLPSAAPADAAAGSGTTRNGDDLAAERAALDVARTALGRGDGKNALVACDDHARRFPRGALSEEREAIAVQALVLEHRPDDARARAERFRKTHPRSILLPAVLAAAGIDQ
ncbi:MAG: hypothetical protein QOI41_7529 [Myxococcales bacterium]|nr:hypothetical protein [Myxococcales bacterium]